MFRPASRFLSALLCSAACLGLPGSSRLAQTPAPAAGMAPNAPAGSVDIAEGTQVHLSLLKNLKSGGDKAGEEVPFEVARDVYGPGHVLLIAADTPAFGKSWSPAGDECARCAYSLLCPE